MLAEPTPNMLKVVEALARHDVRYFGRRAAAEAVGTSGRGAAVLLGRMSRMGLVVYTARGYRLTTRGGSYAPETGEVRDVGD